MTIKQKIMKLVYPLIMKVQQPQASKNILKNELNIHPPVSFHSLQGTLISKQPFSFSTLKGKKVLLVNVASNCGYTGQYSDLETLYQQYKDKLIVLGFPANDFKDQEPGSNQEIANFCKINYGVTFPLFQKQSVLEGENQIYKWLSDPSLNGWNKQQPTWNFCKYLVDENGTLTGFFAAPVSPLADEIVSKVNE
jgi:glutathione peroxidase